MNDSTNKGSQVNFYGMSASSCCLILVNLFESLALSASGILDSCQYGMQLVRLQ